MNFQNLLVRKLSKPSLKMKGVNVRPWCVDAAELSLRPGTLQSLNDHQEDMLGSRMNQNLQPVQLIK